MQWHERKVGTICSLCVLCALCGEYFRVSILGPLRAEEAKSELPEAGGFQALPALRAEQVDLTNPGFEAGENGWRIGKDAFSVVQGEAHGGKASLRFDAGAATKWVPSCSLPIANAKPGIYTLRFWAKLQNVVPPNGTGSGVRVGLNYPAATSSGQAGGTTQVLHGTAAWHAVELRVLIPGGIKDGALNINVHRYGGPSGGEAFFDDFSLEREIPAPVEAYLLYPNYRGYLPADGPQSVRVWVRVNQENTVTRLDKLRHKDLAQVEVLRAGTAERTAVVELPAGVREKEVELAAGNWPLGSYELRVRLGEFQYPSYLIRKISAEQRRKLAVWFDAQNVVHLGSKPLFPLGFYNTVKEFPKVGEQDLARLEKMAEAGGNFHINYTWWAAGMETRKNYLSEMQKRGIWYLDTLMPFQPGLKMPPEGFPIGGELAPEAKGRLDSQEQMDRFLAQLAGNMRQLPAHAGWYVMDERPFALVPEIFHQYTVLRRADPDHPTFGVSNSPAELYLWRDVFDVYGLDPYPLFNMAADRPLTLVADWTRAGVEATRGARPVWMVMQFFQGWAKDRWPTEEELRTMSLMAIVEGARGLFYWSFGGRALADVRDPAQREEYLKRAQNVIKELRPLEPALLAPDAPEIVTAVSEPAVRWRARAANGKWHVFAYLPAQKFSQRADGTPVAVTFTLKDGQKVTKEFRRDTADWFAVPAK